MPLLLINQEALFTDQARLDRNQSPVRWNLAGLSWDTSMQNLRGGGPSISFLHHPEQVTVLRWLQETPIRTPMDPSPSFCAGNCVMKLP